jgi:hypothetical protein
MALKSIFDSDFKYRNADSTDVRLTFERIRREQRRAQRQVHQEEASAKVAGRIVPTESSAPVPGA